MNNAYELGYDYGRYGEGVENPYDSDSIEFSEYQRGFMVGASDFDSCGEDDDEEDEANGYE